ncbi:sensor histidine kinase [Polaribacter sp. MED152]|uniref:sensor histidine kinase n=1 Tax=Polaribacter sp. MED152 TaxID=313598 RepID=UPI0000689A5E|nr:tetratricopeptide repeat-containing sensor histidine kinase [Polaribacter sp. MED152]
MLYTTQDSTYLEKYNTLEKLLDEQDYTVALKNALDLLNQDIDNKTRYKTSLIISQIFANNNSVEKSISYAKRSLKYIKEDSIISEGKTSLLRNNFYLSKAYLNIGNGFLNLSLNDSISGLKYRDSAKNYYDKVINIDGLDKNIQSIKAKASSNLSGIYMQDSAFKMSEKYAKYAISIHENLNNKISQSAALGNLASNYLNQEDYVQAKATYKKALDLIKFETSLRATRIREQLYFNLAYNLYELKDYKAYEAQEKSYNIKDSLRDLEIRTMLEDLDFKYDFESQKKIFLEKAKVKRLEDQRVFLGVGIACLLVIFSLIYKIKLNNLKQNNLALKLSETKLLQNQQIDKLRSETQVRILNATIDGKESERKQIAETLHDSVSALLSSANLHLQATRKQFNGSTPLEIDKTQEIIAEASHKIRDLSHTLVSSVLLKFGLNFAIKEIATKYSNSELIIETEIEKVARYHQNFEIKVYNIINELINNILKHSMAKKALITLKEEEGKLYITIKDNGVGFDKTKINENHGLGINQIDARIHMMKGYFNIDSSKKKGTKITIELPIVGREIMSHV